MVKNLPANAGEEDLTTVLGRYPEEGNGNTLQCACLGNPTDRGAWHATVHWVTRVRHNLETKQQLLLNKFYFLDNKIIKLYFLYNKGKCF